MLKHKLEKINFVVFDLETTGLKAEDEQIIEIAAKKIKADETEIGAFHKFVTLYKKDRLDPFIVSLTNITEALLEMEGNDIDEVMDEFLEFIDDSILVAQNAKFDMSFLMEYYLIDNNQTFGRLHLDTIALAKKLCPDQKSYKLAKLTEMFGVAYDANNHHRADYDVNITSLVLVEELREFGYQDQTLLDLIKISDYRQWSNKQAEFLTSLINKHGFNRHHLDLFSITTASKHIDFFLNKK